MWRINSEIRTPEELRRAKRLRRALLREVDRNRLNAAFLGAVLSVRLGFCRLKVVPENDLRQRLHNSSRPNCSLAQS